MNLFCTRERSGLLARPANALRGQFVRLKLFQCACIRINEKFRRSVRRDVLVLPGFIRTREGKYSLTITADFLAFC